MAIFDQSFDFLLLKYGIVKRVYLKVNNQINKSFKINLEAKMAGPNLFWQIGGGWPNFIGFAHQRGE